MTQQNSQQQTSTIRSRITGTGLGIPAKVLTNKDLEKIVDTSDDWIVTRTGIRERRIIDKEKGQTHTSISVDASREAIAMAGLKPSDIDYVICCTLSPETFMPMGASRIIHELGCGNAAGFDLGAACAGWLVGAEVADSLIQSGKYKNILVIGVEALSEFVNWKDRTTCVLFGDGGAAAVFQATGVKDPKTESCVIATVSHTIPDTNDALCIKGAGSRLPSHHPAFQDADATISMNGQEVFKYATRAMAESVMEVLQKSGFTLDQVKWLIPHQANARIIEMVAKLLKFPVEKTYINIDRWGNTSAGTLPICLAEMNRDGKLQKGDLVMFVTFGGGFAYGAMLVRW